MMTAMSSALVKQESSYLELEGLFSFLTSSIDCAAFLKHYRKGSEIITFFFFHGAH